MHARAAPLTSAHTQQSHAQVEPVQAQYKPTANEAVQLTPHQAVHVTLHEAIQPGTADPAPTSASQSRTCPAAGSSAPPARHAPHAPPAATRSVCSQFHTPVTPRFSSLQLHMHVRLPHVYKCGFDAPLYGTTPPSNGSYHMTRPQQHSRLKHVCCDTKHYSTAPQCCSSTHAVHMQYTAAQHPHPPPAARSPPGSGAASGAPRHPAPENMFLGNHILESTFRRHACTAF